MLAPTSNINNVRACARGDSFSVLRKGLVKAAVGKAWRIKEMKAPGELLVQYKYDANGNLAKVTRKGTDGISRATSDFVWQYKYDPDEPDTVPLDTRHLLKEAVDPNNNSTFYDYELGQVGTPTLAVRRPEGVAHRFNYGYENGQIVDAAVTDGRSNATAYKLRDGYVTEIRAPRGATTSVQFNAEGLKMRETDPEGMSTDYGYDARGNLVSRRMSGGSAASATSAVYDQTFGRPLSETDANGHTTRYTLDGAGNVTSIALPTGKTVSMTYAGNGDLIRTTDEQGLTTQTSYDDYGNPVSVTREAGPNVTVTSTGQYDVRSRPRSTTDSVRAHTSKTYDALDRVVEDVVNDPTGIREGTATTYTYRAGGEVTGVNVAGGTQSYTGAYTVDGLGRVTALDETFGLAGSFTTARSYDGNSNLLSETDRRGVTTTYEYDDLNFKTRTTVSGPFGPPVVTSEAPNLVGNVLSFTDMYAQQTTFIYDGLHREVSRLYPGGYTEFKSLDPNGNLLTFTDRKGRTTFFAYDAVNRLTMRRDPGGRVENWNYADDTSDTVTLTKTPQGLVVITRTDALGRPLGKDYKVNGVNYRTTYTYSGRDCEIKDARGFVTKKTHSAFGDVGSVEVSDADYLEKMLYAAFGHLRYRRDANGRESHFTIDSLNRVQSASYADGFGESWGYDGAGNVTQHTDRRGVSSSMTYDNISRPRTRTVGRVPVLSIEYADSAGTETHTDGNGHAGVYRYDGLRRLVSYTNAELKTKSFVYDGIDMLQESDFKQKFINYAYDAVGRVTQVIDRAGQATLVTHSDVGGYARKVTDRRGNSGTETHDALGRLLSVTAGGQAVVTFEYDENGNRKALTDGRGSRSLFEYDALNRLKSARHSTLQVESYTYDGVGNVLTYHDGRGGKVVTTYDALDHPKTRDEGAGNVTTYKFDGEGLLLERTDPKGPQYRTSFGYNDLRSLERVSDAAGHEWRFSYDNRQNLKSLRDPRAHTVNYDYDVLDRPRSVVQPGGLTTTYGHDANGNLELLTDPNGQKLVTAYDALDRPLTAAHEGAGGNLSLNYQFGHDPEGNLVSVTETGPAGGAAATRTYARTYDARHRLLSATDPKGRAVSYTYDEANNVLSFRDAAGRQTGYEYDALNRLKKATLPGGREVNYGWYADGLLAGVTYGSGMSRAYTYDDADRVTKVTNQFAPAAGEEFDYAYDPNGNRERETRKLNGQVERLLDYGYDELDRLKTVTTRGAEAGPQVASLAYTYDEVGNRKTERGTGYAGQPVERAYDYDELNRLTRATGEQGGDLVYRYDRNGNLREVEQGGAVTSSYEYDARNQMRRALGAGGAEVARYDYDFERRRTAKTAGIREQQFVYGAGGVVNEFAPDGLLLGRYDYGAGPVRGEFAGDGERWLFSDALGSVTSLAAVGNDGAAAAAGRNEYGAWGELLGSAGASANAFGYTGQRLDAETGLMPLGDGERYYSPQLGRFTQQDSWGGELAATPTLNRYAYANSNPLRFVDPSGHWPDWPDLRGIGRHARESAQLFNTYMWGVVEGTGLALYGTARLGVGLVTNREETVRGIRQGYQDWRNEWREIMNDPRGTARRIGTYIKENPHESMRILGNAGGELIGGELGGRAIVRVGGPALGWAGRAFAETVPGRAVASLMRESGGFVSATLEPLTSRVGAAADLVRGSGVGRMTAEGWRRANGPITKLFSREAAAPAAPSAVGVRGALIDEGMAGDSVGLRLRGTQEGGGGRGGTGQGGWLGDEGRIGPERQLGPGPAVEIYFPAKGLNKTQQRLFTEHLAEQEAGLNSMPAADLEMNLLNYRYLKDSGVLRRSRDLAKYWEDSLGVRPPGFHAAHRVDARAGGYTYDIVGFRDPIQSRIGSLWKDLHRQIKPGHRHRLIPEFD